MKTVLNEMSKNVQAAARVRYVNVKDTKTQYDANGISIPQPAKKGA